MIEVIDLEEGDTEFLSIIDSIEAEAIGSASRTKRQKIETKIKEEVEEGDYLAALKGRHSTVWKKNEKQHQNNYGYNTNANNRKQYNEVVSRDTNGGEDVAEKMCVCGIGNCLVLTSNTVKNPGRKFYRCPVRQENGGCNFFEWCDNPPSGMPTSGRAPTEGRSTYGFSNLSNEPSSVLRQTSGNNYSGNQSSTERKGSSCFKCGQEGHWARDCTNSSSDSFSASGYKPNSSGPSGSCFKCGLELEGHWAGDCTNSSSDSFSASGYKPNSSGPAGSCFKCGQEGHWAGDCTNSSSDSFSASGYKLNSSGPAGSCFKCGKPGHWARDCTEQNYTPNVGEKKKSTSAFQTPFANKYN